AWTGCSLTIYDDDPRVGPQIELARAAFRARVPSFGSCWAAQMAVVAAGGMVRANPRGREMGIARKIALTPEGRGHPLYAGKGAVFDAFISHVDEITHLPPGAVLLASNAFTHIQAVSVVNQGGVFWGLQYHPEYDLRELARLTWCRLDKLVKLGFFRDRAAGEDYVRMLETLHQDPGRKDIAWLLGIDEDVTNEDVRLAEVRNWIDRLVIPTMALRH
ncbi:MAG: type 1 glutamine amidotransferase, partial [Stellaceae bacterium]